MDTKISSSFWSDPDIEGLPAETKLAVLWLLTNERISLCGYAEVTAERFAFETRSPSEALARAWQALPKGFVKAGKGYLARNFIAWQFGRGRALAASNMSWPVVQALRLCPPEVVEMVLEEYPELTERYQKACEKALHEPSPSPPQGQRVRVRVREGVRAGEGAGEGEAVSRPAKPASTRPDQHPPAEAARMVAVAGVMKRRPSSVWNEPEKKALRGAGLLELDQADFDEQIALMRRFYLAPIPEAKQRTFWRRTTLPILLNNWPSELDKAIAWAREAGGAEEGRQV